MVTDLWGSEEIGRELGVTARRAREISRSYRSFPVPEVRRKGLHLWRADIVRMWIEGHGGRDSSRPSKIRREARSRLGRTLGQAMGRHGMTDAGLADVLHVDERYISGIREGTTPDGDWPTPAFLREAARILGEHPAILMEAADYTREANAERGDYGRDNRATQAAADSLHR
jgi:transcriptional regulator with XRE-family HTH domain